MIRFEQADVVKGQTRRGVTEICQEMADNGGDFSGIFENERLRPLLVMHFAGFQAYATHLANKRRARN